MSHNPFSQNVLVRLQGTGVIKIVDVIVSNSAVYQVAVERQLTSAVGRDYRGWVLLSWDSEKRILKDGFYTYKEGEGRGSCDKGVCEIFTLLSGLYRHVIVRKKDENKVVRDEYSVDNILGL